VIKEIGEYSDVSENITNYLDFAEAEQSQIAEVKLKANGYILHFSKNHYLCAK
jgi:hypothetical protein